MAKLRPSIEWASQNPRTWTKFGIRKLADNKWEVVSGVDWAENEEYKIEMVVDSRDAAIGFIKLLKG